MTINTKFAHMLSARRIMAVGLLLVLIVLSLMQPLAAQSITQGYGSDEPLQKGMLVELKENDGSKVVVATAKNIEKVHGVVVNANDAPVTLSNDTQKVFVATQGKFELLVSSENGAITTGDYLTVSSVNGVAMKADTRQSVAVAKSLVKFDGKTDIVSTQQVGGKAVNIGRISADIAIAHNPLAVPERATIPKILQSASEFVARKPVSAPRLYTSIVILVMSMGVSGAMFYIGVRSSLIAIGRNPLSKKDITRSLLQVILTSLIVFIIGLFAVYLLLKL